MTRLTVNVNAQEWCNPATGRDAQARRRRLAAFLADVGDAIEHGQVEGRIKRPGLVGDFKLELPAAADAA
jgi:hypothetical protein